LGDGEPCTLSPKRRSTGSIKATGKNGRRAAWRLGEAEINIKPSDEGRRTELVLRRKKLGGNNLPVDHRSRRMVQQQAGGKKGKKERHQKAPSTSLHPRANTGKKAPRTREYFKTLKSCRSQTRELSKKRRRLTAERPAVMPTTKLSSRAESNARRQFLCPIDGGKAQSYRKKVAQLMKQRRLSQGVA